MRQSDLGLKANPEPGRPKYLYAIIREDMRRRLCHAKSGDRLSTERQLALEFKVDLITVKRAMSDLESDGLVYRHQGRGTFATEKVALLKKMAVAQHESMAEVVRQAIDFFAKAKQGLGDEQKRRRAMAAAGQFRSGVNDLAASHDYYLTEIFSE